MRMGFRICTETYKVRVLYPRNSGGLFENFGGKLTSLRLLKNFRILRTTRSSHVCLVEVYKIRVKILRSPRREFLPLRKYSLIDFETRFLHQNGRELELTWEGVLRKYL